MSRVGDFTTRINAKYPQVPGAAPPPKLLSPGLDFRDRPLHCLIHGAANLMVGLRHAFLVEVLAYRAEHAVAVGIVEIGGDDIRGVSLGRCAGHSELLGGPQADQLVAPCMRLQPKFLIMRELAFEAFLALVERAHNAAPLCCAI